MKRRRCFEGGRGGEGDYIGRCGFLGRELGLHLVGAEVLG